MATASNVLMVGAFMAILLNNACAGTTNRTRYKITTIITHPYMMVMPNAGGKNGTYYAGFIVDVLQELSHYLDFDYDIVLVADNFYGAPSVGGKWNGMIGELARGEADIAAAPLTVTAMRTRAVDFSQQFMSSGTQILMQKPRSVSLFSTGSVHFPLQPLPAGVWGLTIVAFIAVSVLLHVIWRWSPFEWGTVALEKSSLLKESFNLKNSFFFSLSAMFWQGYRVAPRSVSGRIITGVWWAFTAFLLLSYTASLTGLVLARYTGTAKPIETFDDLAKSDMSYGTILGGKTMFVFKNSQFRTRHMMWEKMDQNKSVLVRTTQEGIHRVRYSDGNYAFIMEGPAAEYAANRAPCDLMVSGEPLTDDGYAFACKKGSGVCSDLSYALLMLKESERLHLIRRKWFAGECSQQSNVVPKPLFLADSKLTLVDFSLAFGLVLIGIIIAVAALVLEILLNRKGVVVATTYKDDETRIPDSGEGM